MAIKKTELYSMLWKSCDELRGGMDASQYKDYVLTMLFVKYVSDKYAGRPNALIDVPPDGSFAAMVRLKGDKEIGDKMNKIVARLAEANDLRGTIDLADFNDADKLGRGQAMVDRLSNLVAIFENPSLDFSRNQAEGDDLLGDAYEYLMRNFATESGKSKGQFYTPGEVSRIMAKVIGINRATRASQTVYDPTCGSGSLLLRAADESGMQLSVYGQEMDNATAALARMNMILHGRPTAEIWQDNTLTHPQWVENGHLKLFDYAVANPPFSYKVWSSGLNPAEDEYYRFELGIPPKKNGDYAFLLHLLSSLKSTGKGAIIMPHGVLFRGNTEGEIRRNLVQRGYIQGIIGLPANLFYGTGIPACIIILDKENAVSRSGIFMVDASKGFAKDGPKNRLRERDIHQIVDTYTRRLKIPGYARMVPRDEVAANDYNLNIPRYIDSSEPEDIQDITAHLCGGIPNRDLDVLEAYWNELPGLREALFAAHERPGYSQPKVGAAEVKAAILAHLAFTAFQAAVRERFDGWLALNRPRLMELNQETAPKALIAELSESLLTAFAGAPLVNPYEIFQRLMLYWGETMQDDVYLITAEGWLGASRLRPLGEDERLREKPDLERGRLKLKADLIPPDLVIARYFAVEQSSLEELRAEFERLAQQMEEIREEQGGEEGLLAEVVDEKGGISKGALTARLKEIRDDAESAEERQALEAYAALLEAQTTAVRSVREAQATLTDHVIRQYSRLTEDEVKALVIDDKWLAAWTERVTTEMERISQRLTGRIKQLAERYAHPLTKIEQEVQGFSAKVASHLQKIGAEWN